MRPSEGLRDEFGFAGEKFQWFNPYGRINRLQRTALRAAAEPGRLQSTRIGTQLNAGDEPMTKHDHARGTLIRG